MFVLQTSPTILTPTITGTLTLSTTSGSGLAITSTVTTSNVLSVTGDSLTTGSLGYFYSNSADVSSRFLVFIHNDNTLATGATCLRLQQDSTNQCLTVDMNGDGTAIQVESDSPAGTAINFATTLQTTGNIISVPAANSLTTGRIISAISNSADVSSRFLVFIHNDNTLATGATCLRLQQDSTNQCLTVDMNGEGTAIQVESDTTTGVALNFATTLQTTGNIISVPSANSLTTGSIASFISNSASSATRSLVNIINDDPLATGASCLTVRNDYTGITTILGGTSIGAGVTIGATGRLYLDGGGDTFIYESSANIVTHDAGGASRFQVDGTNSFVRVVNSNDFSLPATRRLYLDGGGNTSIRESSADTVQIEVGGGDRVTIETNRFSLGSGVELNMPAVDPPTANYANRNGIVKGWAAFEVTAASIGNVRDDYNVSSFSVNASGDMTINWDLDFTPIAGVAAYAYAFGISINSVPNWGTYSTASISIEAGTGSTTWFGSVIAIGDQ